MKRTTLLALFSIAALASGCEGLLPDGDGIEINCATIGSYPGNSQPICVDAGALVEHGTLDDAICKYRCRQHWSDNGATPPDYCDDAVASPEEDTTYCDVVHDWLEIVDVDEISNEGWECRTNGSYTILKGGFLAGYPHDFHDPVKLDTFHPDSWQTCAPSKSSANTNCDEICVQVVADIYEDTTDGEPYFFRPEAPLESDDWPEGYIAVSSPTGWDIEAYCAEMTYPAPATVPNCPVQLVNDPMMETLVWDDGAHAPLDCDLNNTCCTSLGVCDDLLAHENTSAADRSGAVTGTVEILVDGSRTVADVSGMAKWSADPCDNPNKTCPIYLGSLDLEVASLSGTEGNTIYSIRPVTAALTGPIMGAWKPATGEVVFPPEAVLFELTAEASIQVGRVVTTTSHRESRRTDGGLRGTLVDDVLSLDSVHTASRTGSVSFDITAR